MFESWNDQKRDLEALRALLADGRADAIAENIVGPAYMGAAAALAKVFGLAPDDALVVLTRASYALGVAAGLVLVRVLLGRLVVAPPIVSLGSQFAFLALVFAAGTWYWSDVPWSHFFAAFLAVALYAARFAPAGASLPSAATVGALAALLAATRTFELVAIVLAWCTVALLLSLLGASARAWSRGQLLAVAVAFVATTAVVYAGTGKREPFLYGNDLSQLRGSAVGAVVAETPPFSFSFVPAKLVQLFVDPCYLSLCEISDYETGGGSGSNLDLWSLPLSVQLPALLLLPACVVAVLVLLVRGRRRRDGPGLASLGPLAEITVAATGLVVGYAASTLIGPSHLRYGLARDFLLPASLTAVVAVVLGSSGLWKLLSSRRHRISPEIACVATCVIVSVVVVAASTAARSSGLPRLEARHLAEVSYDARCVAGECEVRIRATTVAGRETAIPEASTLTFGCGSDRARFSVYTSKLSQPVRVDESCIAPRLVAAWPTVMGLPPGSFEHAAVRVSNA
jgi:hypothetical protein